MDKPDIYIIDTFSPRIIDTESHVFGFARSVKTLEMTQNITQASLAVLLEELEKSEHPMVIMNYVAATRYKVLTSLREVEPKTVWIRKILQTCKSRDDTLRGLWAIGETLSGVRHVRWDGEKTEKNKWELHRILKQQKK